MGLRGTWRVFRQGEGVPGGLPAWAYAALFVACMALGYWSIERYHTVVLWPANGVLLAGVLLLPKRDALRMLAACFVLNLVGNVIRHDAAHMVVINTLLNFGEILLCAALARRFCGATLDLRRPARLARFALCCAAPVVLVSGLIGVTVMPSRPGEWGLNLYYWFTIETLGLLATTPAMLLFARAKHFTATHDRPKWEKAALFGLLAVVATAVFAQDRAPLLFLTFLPLTMIAFRLPPHWSALSVLLLTVIGGAFSLNGMGPLTLSRLGPENWRDQSIQQVLNLLPALHLYLVASIALAFGASTVLTERRRLEDQLTKRTQTAQRARAVAEEAERRVTHMAQHDADTGLLNRVGLERVVAEMLDVRRGRDVYVAALAIDRFASIRTAIGSEQASTLLHQAAERLAFNMRRVVVGRLSPNTLGVALRATSVQDATAQLGAARLAFEAPVDIGASRVDVRFVIGLAGAPDHAEDAPGLIERAQVALDQASLAHQHYAVFDAAAEYAAAEGLAMLSEFHAGLDDGSVWLAHQPKLDLRSGDWGSVECLLRWTHAERGPVTPATFIPLLEETGSIGGVTDWVLSRALTEQAMLARSGSHVGVAVNVSARSLSDPGFAARLTYVVSSRGARCENVTLEITETALMTHENVAVANLEALKTAGFRISIDDYGAGMSSLSYLKRIPADELKIDASFVRRLAQDKTDAVLVRSTIELAHSLGLKVVAEGVEDAQTLEILRLFGCDYAQGYFIARPMPLARLAELRPKEETRVVA